MNLQKLSRLSSALLLLPGIFMGCSRPAVEPVSGEVEAPPSIQQAEVERTVLVHLDDSEVDALRIETHQVTEQSLSHDLDVPGEVMHSPEHFSIISAPISGRVVSIAAHEGEAVRKGGLLLEMESLEFADLVAEYLNAHASLALREVERARTKQLVNENIAAQRTLDQRDAELKQARASFAASLARLRAVGVSKPEIDEWVDAGPESYGVLKVRAPISGIIDHHMIDLGSAVNIYDEMLTLVDPGHVMVKGYAPPGEADGLQVGDTVLITGRQQGDEQLEATVTSINPALDAENKSVVVNILTPTKEGWPIQGDLVNVAIKHQNTVAEMLLPISSIQYEGNRAAVFVKQSASVYEKRFVDIGRIDQDFVVVRSGVSTGDEVAITQVFNLKAISRFEQYGEE